MAEREAIVGHAEGLHARPAALLVREARQFASGIKIESAGKTANAKSPLSLMTLGARKGDRVIVKADGPDAEAAVDALTDFIAAGE